MTRREGEGGEGPGESDREIVFYRGSIVSWKSWHDDAQTSKKGDDRRDTILVASSAIRSNNCPRSGKDSDRVSIAKALGRSLGTSII